MPPIPMMDGVMLHRSFRAAKGLFGEREEGFSVECIYLEHSLTDILFWQRCRATRSAMTSPISPSFATALHLISCGIFKRFFWLKFYSKVCGFRSRFDKALLRETNPFAVRKKSTSDACSNSARVYCTV